MTMREYAEKVKPQVKGMSDKYSWNLYNFLKKRRPSRILRLATYSEYEHDLFLPSRIVFMPYDDTGFKLGDILGRGAKAKPTFVSACSVIEDITQEFIEEYLKIGRCLFDNNHNGGMLGVEKRWEYESDTHRICKWCGMEQKEEEVIIKKNKWINQLKDVD